jgi:hypothetical protein
MWVFDGFGLTKLRRAWSFIVIVVTLVSDVAVYTFSTRPFNGAGVIEARSSIFNPVDLLNFVTLLEI